MTDLVDNSIREAVGVFLDAAPPAHVTPPAGSALSSPTRQPRRPVLLVTASTVAVIAVAVSVVVWNLDSVHHSTTGATTAPADATAPPNTDVATAATQPIATVFSPPPTTALPTPPPPASTGAPLFNAPAGPVSWLVLNDASTITSSSVTSIVVGPAGFVAVGMGFDDGKNQGRVWHSPDGVSWSEPDLPRFDALQVWSLAATSDAYYLIAQPNPDRNPEPWQPKMYRSFDGQTWIELGDAPVSEFASTGDALIGNIISNVHTGSDGIVTGEQSIVTSADGVTWTPALFAGLPPAAQTSYDFANVVVGGGYAFLRGSSTADQTVVQRIWSSTDGITWRDIPDATAPGPLTATANGLLLTHNNRFELCETQFGQPPRPPADWQARMEHEWNCVGQTTFEYLPFDGTAWVALEPVDLAPSPEWQVPISFANTLTIATVAPTAQLTLTTSTDAIRWTPLTGVNVNLAPQGIDRASPPRPIAAASSTAAVFAVPLNSTDGPRTALIVGSLQTK